VYIYTCICVYIHIMYVYITIWTQGTNSRRFRSHSILYSIHSDVTCVYINIYRRGKGHKFAKVHGGRVLSVLQCVAVCCSMMQRVTMYHSVLHCVALCCSALYFNALQCDAVCYRVLQCVPV